MYTPSELRNIQPNTEFVQRIYMTQGYGRDVLKLPVLLETLEAVLIDIRLSPPIQPLKFSKEYLKLLLKNNYRHVPLLGSRTSTNDLPAIQNLKAGLKIITALKTNALLFCVCENDKLCHRHLIGTELSKENIIVRDLESWTLSDAP